MTRKLYRASADRMLLGVCGGLADYFRLDSTLVRLAAVVLMLFTFPIGPVLYFAFAVIMPLAPGDVPWRAESASGGDIEPEKVERTDEPTG